MRLPEGTWGYHQEILETLAIWLCYPLVNVYIANWKITIFHGITHYKFLEKTIFNSYVKVPEGRFCNILHSLLYVYIHERLLLFGQMEVSIVTYPSLSIHVFVPKRYDALAHIEL